MTLVRFETKLARFRAAQARRKEREKKWEKARARNLARIGTCVRFDPRAVANWLRSM